ncbi:LemA family protein [candidate division KSB1 bacterium RBG_16_48_16]|nr:MAG: LemA family protein [candidate division KSB1 bacterium RBG_16_48_16]
MSKGAKIGIGILVIIVVFAIILFSTFKNAYNSFVRLDEEVNNSWAQVQNVLQRRMDLIPNLVETVKGYANFERETLEAVIQARANATRLTVDAGELAKNPEQLSQFMGAQNGLSAALGRLMVVIERYPELKANQNFIRLQDELAGTENRIAVERRRFNETTRTYNQKIRQFPDNIIASMFGFQQRPYFEAPQEAQQAPRVDFGSSNR